MKARPFDSPIRRAAGCEGGGSPTIEGQLRGSKVDIFLEIPSTFG